ncbi:uncharacterized protein EDB91DRAFT_1249736 [Suillus paluster]|uniref:uncharacterized protein n=1 Tax=Suillus paluster TaxID=48578 RepID=UPI001B872704|nr:uncharacterized protein EDB91DRAFT_1249736 [Suillus paluster]KAG1737089.1 hypothetical protein EDB91DRAFT_1249736 [Suillus paluster]
MSTGLRFKCICARCLQHPDGFMYQTQQVIAKHTKKWPPVVQPSAIQASISTNTGTDPMTNLSRPSSEGTGNNQERPQGRLPTVEENEYDFDFIDDNLPAGESDNHPVPIPHPRRHQVPGNQLLQDFNFCPVA